jgi:nicotinate dehydrogenase subunit A
MPETMLIVNGTQRQVDAAPGDRLLDVLRHDLALTGTKYGCGEGQCGACTVLVDGRPVRSCTTRLESVHGATITTIEGLARDGRLHPVQEAFLEVEAFQCGYCTPGMTMAVVGLLQATPRPSDADIARELDRNVCRCGEYRRIVDAVHLAARRMAADVSGGDDA